MALAATAAVWIAFTPRPDIYEAPDGQAAALRGSDGRLSVLRSGRDTFAVREWLAADADGRAATDKTLTESVRCDEGAASAGCVMAD